MRKTKGFLLNYLIFSLLFAGAALLTGKAALEAELRLDGTSPTIAEQPIIQLVIDPGHGGEDGGAIQGEVVEKDLNLSVAMGLHDFLTVFGYSHRLTRDGDTLLYDHYGELEDYTGHKKAYDLRNRLRIAEESEGALYVGIHMNKFSQPQYSGLQVYYSKGCKESQIAARLVQSYARRYISPDNSREIKAAGDSIYILDRIDQPAILVECGFLSNPEECALLCREDYRTKLAVVIFASSAEYLSSGEK